MSEKIHLLTKTEQKNKELQRYEGDLLKCLEERGALEAAAEETDNSTLTRPQLVAGLTNLTRQLTQLREELWLANSAKTQLGRTIVHLREQVNSTLLKLLQNIVKLTSKNILTTFRLRATISMMPRWRRKRMIMQLQIMQHLPTFITQVQTQPLYHR